MKMNCSECQFEDGAHSQACSQRTWGKMPPWAEDPEYRPGLDPAALLPYECRLEPDDPTVEKLTAGYSGSNSHSILDADLRIRGV